MKKHTYRIRNWSKYNASLKKRGSLTVWVSPEAVENWTTDELTGEQGASPTYTDLAIETMATVQAIYGLAGRQTQGFLQSIFELMNNNCRCDQIEIEEVEAAMILASARRLLRSHDAPRLGPIRSLHYFLPVIEDIRSVPVSADYIQYLRGKLAAFEEGRFRT